MKRTTATNDLDFEQTLLFHVELCYSVAFALTRDPDRALVLAKETLQWAWQRGERMADTGSLKMSLLSELRGRYRRNCRAVRNRPASGRKPL